MNGWMDGWIQLVFVSRYRQNKVGGFMFLEYFYRFCLSGVLSGTFYSKYRNYIICLSVCLSLSFSLSLFVFQSLSLCLSVPLTSLSGFVCHCLPLSTFQYVFLSIFQCIFQSVCLSFCLFIVSVFLSVF